ncbi:hypothetical protein [uncultured Ruegeria sp.]|uniref:hypothetical protein n=1 Tax=uncultured Ruegeria sp. TaxID=259304 RepID=UPI00261074A1|nr:hypothetical protein [uncultured Ruegeria sp.]
MISIKILFVSAAVWFSPMAALSEVPPLQGEDAPEFKEAVQAWLDGEDLAALRSLSEQAQNGNAAAQILLANIVSRSGFHVHVTSEMNRKDRIALLRKPGGLSGKSWLTEAQNSEPLALALLQVAKFENKAPAIAVLVELGEPITAMLAAQSMLYDGEGAELVEVLQGLDHKLPEEASIFLFWALYLQKYSSDGSNQGGSASLAWLNTGDDRFMSSELAWGLFTPRELIIDTGIRETATKLSSEIVAWTPIRNFCSDYCADEVPDCTVTAAALLASPYSPRSPLQSLIANEDYWSSDRLEGDVARSIRDIRDWKFDSEYTYNQCFTSNMRAAQRARWP